MDTVATNVTSTKVIAGTLSDTNLVIVSSITIIAIAGIGFLIWYLVKRSREPSIKIHYGYSEFLSHIPVRAGNKLVEYKRPETVANPALLLWNDDLARELKIEKLKNATLYLAGSKLLKGSKSAALAYSGHQFGQFNTLGDGRALLLGTVMVPNGAYAIPVHMQLKGTGPNSFSRNGDGLLPVGPALREMLMSEAMYGLKIPTIRCLSVVATGRKLRPRKAGDVDVQGAVLCRMLKSMERVGTFEHVAQNAPIKEDDGTRDYSGLKLLADFVIQNYFNGLHQTITGKRRNTSIYGDLALASAKKNAKTVALCMTYGFVHGVWNTDNVLVTGDIIDYGPCAFLDNFGMDTVFSSIDKGNRYGYGKQPDIMLWNMHKLLDVLKLLIEHEPEPPFDQPGTWKKRLDKAYDSEFKRVFLQKMMARLGVQWKSGMAKSVSGMYQESEAEIEKDEAFISQYLQALQENKQDYNDSFLKLEAYLEQMDQIPGKESTGAPFIFWLEKNGDWMKQWRARLKNNKAMQDGNIFFTPVTEENYKQEALKIMHSANPRFIPRNHDINRLTEHGRQLELDLALKLLRNPWTNNGQGMFKAPNRLEASTVTFCGT